MQEYKICTKCNYKNIKETAKCENCGAEIGFNNNTLDNNEAANAQTDMTNNEMTNNQILNGQNGLIINDSSIDTNQKNKTEKNASQMMWMFIGNWLFYGLVAWLIQELKPDFIRGVFALIFNLLISFGALYLIATGIFKKNILYKNQKDVFVKKIKKFYNIWFAIQLILELGGNLIMRILFFRIDLFDFISSLFTASFGIILLNLILQNIIFPRIILIPLIKERGIESVNEEVKS